MWEPKVFTDISINILFHLQKIRELIHVFSALES